VNDDPPREDLDAVAAALELRFPDLRPLRPLHVLGRGFRSLAVETAGGRVLRVGRSPDAAVDYEKEWRTAPFLVEHLPELLPKPRWYTPPAPELPHGALGYDKLPGRTPPWGTDPGADFARDLGRFMARLHSLPVRQARAAAVPEVDSYRRLLGARDVVMPHLAARLDSAALHRVEEWWEVLAADARMASRRVAVCHHDLWHDNLLISETGRLCGVLDLAHVELSDPAHDFGAPRYFGEAFMTELIAAYRAGDGQFGAEDRYRARRFYEGREFGGLAWAIEHSNEREIEEAVAKVRKGPVVAGR
jgi:aminoglycoside phosphotransferase (APT) family kinase protein